MRVAHVISSIDPVAGGPVSALEGLTLALRRLDVEVTVVATYARGADLTRAALLEAAGVAVEPVGPVRPPLGWHRKLRPTLERVVANSNVVHIHGLWEQVQHAAARVTAAHAKPHIFRPCGMLDPWSLRQGWWKKRLYMRWRLRRDLKSAAALHFTADEERRLTEPLGLRVPAIVEPNGLEVERYCDLPPRTTFRAQHPMIGDRPVVLFLGRVHPKKGLDVLLPAIARVRAGEADAARGESPPLEPVLVIAGPCEPAYRRTLDRLVTEHGLANAVLFTGMLQGEQKLAALVDADVFALPSYQENFGIAVIEALAAGVPVIVSDRVNIAADLVRECVGEVVPPAVEPVAAALARWLHDPTRRRDAGQRGRALAQRQYDWQQIAQRWIKHYQQLGAP